MNLICTRGFGEKTLVCPVVVEASTDTIEIEVETGIISLEINIDPVEVIVETDECDG